MDDDEINIKVKGCKLLRRLLDISPALLLERTGLGDVFEDALFPMLSSLPPLTPENQSLQLLGHAYPTLLALQRARFPSDAPSSGRVRSLDRIMRAGILQGYAHANEHVKVANLLVEHLTDLVAGLGIHAVKHLKVETTNFVVCSKLIGSRI